LLQPTKHPLSGVTAGFGAAAGAAGAAAAVVGAAVAVGAGKQRNHQ